MESLSRPFHSRKLSNATTFSAKNAYDGVFSGHRHNYAGASPINLEDYREIFSSSPAASSIPMLNLSTLVEQSDAFNLNLNLNLRSSNSKPDYSKIFGGFRDEDVAVSYEELFAGDKSRAPSSKTSSSSDSDNLSHQSSESLKQFNMSYNKITQKSKDGLDETRYVKELHAIPGFTRFIDEAVPPLMEDKKHESSADHVSVDSSKRSKHHSGESLSEDTKFKTFDNVKVHLSTVSSASASPISRKDYPKRSTSINFDSSKGPRGFSPAYNDEEVNMNSAASDSGAALKKAIEKAQESIRIAKESVGRKKKGLRSFSSKTFKDSLNVEGRVTDVTASEAQKCKDEVREVFERATTSSQGFSEVGKTRKYFMDSEKLFVAKKFIDEMHGKISESTKECSMSVESCNKMKDNTIVSGSAQVMDETECRPLETAKKDEYATFHPEAVDTEKGRIESLDFLADQIDNYEGKMKATAVYNSTQVTGETVEVDMSRESKENKDEVRLSNAHEIVKELNNLSVSQKAEDEKRVPQEEVLEQECIENAEEIEMHRRNSDDDISDIGLEDGNESKDDCTTDNTIHESKEGAQSCDDNLEESEASLQDDCEMKQEDNHRGERKGESSDNFSDQELDEILSGDDNVSEETYSADGIHVASNIVVDTHESCKVDMNDNNVETTQETDTCFAQIGTEEQSESSSWEEEEEEEEEQQQQQQQQQQQSNIQLSQEEIPETESINEIQESQEPLYKKEKTMEDTEEMRTSEDKEKENEIRETGPSKAVGTENKERIDEVAARELEREKDRLAVDRAIREARERARERVERAAVEKATEEIRQRMMADAREKACAEARERAERAAVEKATEEIRQRMRADAREKAAKASAQSKLRAERAAVERATSEARQRALEKAMSKKPLQEDSSGSNGTSSESALRKAKLEKDNKIMERTAKALAEKEKRDLLAQKEQAERNRLAENLDADIKKWSSGKEGNLRALLSTLHNILGSESGWQPVTLAEIVATSAVKKAYRKATLCVHPDKLQQRGASIQHKYICEKVFDLLKAAWNKFNSEKR